MHLSLFLLTATVLLGTPGPGIAALLAAGRQYGLIGAMPLYAGIQVGLAIAAGVSAGGLTTLILGVPEIRLGLSLLATVYLVWIAWCLASAPVGNTDEDRRGDRRFGFGEGFLLGAANPKAYLAFMSLFASFTVVPTDHHTDAAVKWIATIAVVLVVDIAWLVAGAALGRIHLAPRIERVMNIVMGGLVVAAAGFSMI